MSSPVRTATAAPQHLNIPNYEGVWRSLAILLLAATPLLIAWSFAIPIFEAPDEPFHWEYAQYIHDRGRLPLYSAAFVEANQPPLYYWLIAPVCRKTELPP